MTINTAEIENLIVNMRDIHHLRQRLGSLRYQTSITPVFRPPVSTNEYENIGKNIGMAGKEIEYLFDEILRKPDEYELAALKQMLMLAKLKYPQASMKYTESFARAKEVYDQECARLESSKATYNSLEQELISALNNEKFVDQMTIWHKVVDGSKAALDAVNNRIDDLADADRAFFKVLLDNSKYVQLVKDAEVPTADVDWEHIRNNLNPEHINTIFRKWIKISEEHNF